MPSARPTMKPPICEKLSNPGRRPSTKEMTISMRMKNNSRPGLRRSLHEYRRSSKVMAMIPNKEPEAPVEEIPDAAKLPPRTKPKIPALTYTRKKRMEPMAISISRPMVS